MTIRCMRFACCITNATYGHAEYVLLIAFPLQKWLRESASMMRYTYMACLVSTEYSRLNVTSGQQKLTAA